MLKGKFYPVVVGLLLASVILSLQFSEYPLVREAMQRLDYTAYDLRLRATLKKKEPDPRIVIIDIDEKSLREEGHFPWSRDRLALLVEKLFGLGVVVVAFDIVFPEAERNAGEMVVQRLRENRLEAPGVAKLLSGHLGVFDNNAVFAEALRGGDAVMGFIFDYEQNPPKGVLPQPVQFADPAQAAAVDLIEPSTYTSNIAQLGEAGGNGGFFSLRPDADGIFRRTPMLQRYKGAIYPSLALEAVRRYYLLDKLQLKISMIGERTVVETIQLGDRAIPTDSLGRSMVPFRGPRGSYPYISATDVIRDRLEGDMPLAGTIALVGTTAQGLFDLRATPVDGVYPGVEVHANIISGILDNEFPVEPTWAEGANFSMTVGVGILLALTLPFLSPLSMVMFSVAVGAAVIGFNFWSWSEQGLILDLAPSLMLVVVLPLFNVAYGFWQEFRGRQRLKGMFGQYVPPELVEEMNRRPEADYGFEGESRELSVLFCDIRSFTTISESLSATQLKEMLNEFFTPMTKIIFENRGTIDKYVGDMIMAFWGAPVEDPGHARHAIDAALQMLAACEALKPEFRRKGLPEVNIGIGINTGLMNVGDMGSEYRRAYTVLGDSVNLASRLEGTTKFYGVGLVVGEETRRQAGDAFLFCELDRVRVKGKAQAITVYEPVCRAEEGSDALQQELAAYGDALSRFRSRDWSGARDAFTRLRDACPGRHIYELYLERIEELSQNDPGEAWDGVYERTTK